MKRILLILSLCICLTLASCSNDYGVSTNDTDDSQLSNDYDTAESPNTDTALSFDVTKFANISAKELISMFGEPSSVDDGYGKGFCDIPAVYYNYENNKTFGNVIFVLVNNSVVRMTSNHFYSYDNDYFDSVEETLLHFGITKDDNCETVVENEIARRYRCPSKNVDDIFFGPSFGVDNGFGQLEVTYDMSYYEEWYLPTIYDEFAKYNPHSKEFIKQFLNYPNTAKFSALNYEDKSNDYYFWISSTVEAKNAFGVASEYAYNVIYDRATSNVVYADLGGEVLLNDGYKETYDIIKSKHNQALHQESLNSSTVVANKMGNPFQEDYTNDNVNDSKYPDNSNRDNDYETNDESILFDALAEFCNKYNDEGGRLFEETIAWKIITPTEVELYLSTEYSLTVSQITEFDTLASEVLNEIVSFVDNNYYFPEIITFNLTMEYYEADDYSDDYSNDEGVQLWTETDLPITLKNDSGEIVIKNITFYADYNDDGSGFFFITFWSDKLSSSNFRMSYSLVGENTGTTIHYNDYITEFGNDGESGNHIFSVDHDPIVYDSYTIIFDDMIQ